MKLALRQLLKSPGFTAVALITLALGIGANVGVFSFLNALLTRPLPLPRVNELVFWGEHSEQVPGMSVSWPNFVDWQQRQKSFSDFGVFRSTSVNYVGASETERLNAAQFSHGLWRALGVSPRAGRWFTANDDKPGAAPTLLVSESFADRIFGSPEAALDQKLVLSGEIYTVIGVMPTSFRVPGRGVDAWMPFGLVANQNMDRGNHPGLFCIGRLKPGVSLESARADFVGIAQQLAAEYPKTNTGNSVNMQLLVDVAVGGQRTAAWIAFGAAMGVLLIACANVANLLLARGAAREREFAVRAAMGATRARLIRLVLTESLLLGLTGTALGLLVGTWTIQGIKTIIPQNSGAFVDAITMDTPVLAFAAAVGVGVTLLFGLMPAIAGSKINLNAALAAGGRSGGGMVNARWRSVLVASEFALTLVLLFATGLMLRTIRNYYEADAGLKTDHVVSFGYNVSGKPWSDPAKRVQLMDRALERLRALPGVTQVALTNPLPLTGGGNQTFFLPEGAPDPGPGKKPSTENNVASAAYFETMRIPLVRGRTFTDQDRANTDRVCVIDTHFAETQFAGQDPLGRRVVIGDGTAVTIVGIVGHIQNFGIGAPTRVQMYSPYRQTPPNFFSFVVRTTQNVTTISSQIRDAMREVEPTLPVYSIRTMDEIFDSTVSRQRIMVILLSVFAGLGVLLAAIGLYGVLSYIVGQRTREVGIRMALGATGGAVRRLILGQGLKLAAFGLGLGLLAAIALTRLMASLLYGVSAYDPVSLAAVSLTLIAVGLFASWLPARRATRVNPTEALRAD